MKTIWTIARRELGAYFSSPVAYVFIVIFLLLTGFFTFMVGRFFERGSADLLTFFVWHPWLYLFLVPAVGMRLWSEELRLGTMELLFTMPVTTWQAILGKFLASWLFLLIALVLTFPIVVTVEYLGHPDLGRILSGYGGSFLMAGAFLAITCMTSSLTAQSGRQLHSIRGDLPVPDPLQLAAGHRHRGQLGARLADRHPRGGRRHDSLRRLPARRDRQPRSDLLFIRDRVLSFHHQRHSARASSIAV